MIVELTSPPAGEAPPSSLRAIRRVSVKDTAVQRICDAIELGELKAGDPLTELGLARQLGVGQPTIREALLELEHIGFVERISPRKTRVTLLTRRVIDEIYVVRERLETLAAELAAQRESLDLRDCYAAVERMEAAAAQPAPPDFYRADLAFHRALWRCAGNECLESSLERLVPKLFAFGIIQHAQPVAEEFVRTAKAHRQLLDLIAAREVRAAGAVMEQCIRKGWLEDAPPAEAD
jgi:DNA-binding GntR family transcriptional regulator